jgi:hypothetical protein
LTPLHDASHFCHIDIVKYLKSKMMLASFYKLSGLNKNKYISVSPCDSYSKHVSKYFYSVFVLGKKWCLKSVFDALNIDV